MGVTFRRSLITFFLFVSIIMFNRCIYVGALLMGIEEKKIVDTWRSEKYKTRIQRRLGWAGPPYFQCRIKMKTLGGLYYRTIIKETFSRDEYATCIIKYPFRKDTVVVNICKKNTFRLK